MAAHELGNEMGGVEVKQAVVVYYISACGVVLNVQGGVAVKFIDGLAGLAGEQAYAQAVSLGLGAWNEQYD